MLFLIFLLSCASTAVFVSAEVICVTPSENESISQNTDCVTLSQVIASNKSFLEENTALIFLHGNHSLDSNFILQNKSTLVMHSRSNSTRVTCKQLGKVSLHQIESGSISNLEFVSCPLDLHNVSINIKRCSLSLNVNSMIRPVLYSLSLRKYFRLYTGALYITKSNVTISSSIFEKNQAEVGGAVFVEHSFLKIVESFFKDNHVKCLTTSAIRYQICFGGAVYLYNSTTNVTSSVFENNSAEGAESHGGVFGMISSSVNIHSSTFINNAAPNGSGGVFFTRERNTIISNQNNFVKNSAGKSGGVLSSMFNIIILMDKSSYFENNQAKLSGGVIYAYIGEMTISRSRFCLNKATKQGGAVTLHSGTLVIYACDLIQNNVESFGGAINVPYSRVNISNCNFKMNTAYMGGAIHAESAHIYMRECTYTFNKAKKGGALVILESKTTIVSCNLSSNSADEGGAAYILFRYKSGAIHFNESIFLNNAASTGGVLYVKESTLFDTVVNDGNLCTSNHSIVQMHSITASFNVANIGLMYFVQITGIISGSTEFFNNTGSIFLYSSHLSITGHAKLVNTSSSMKRKPFQEGGVLTAFQSYIFLTGVCQFLYNFAENGGALHATGSKLYMNGYTIISNNTSERNGGGVYLYQSELNCVGDNSSVEFLGNTAGVKGGAMYAVSSSLRVSYSSVDSHYLDSPLINFTENKANYGGGIFLEVTSKVYILTLAEGKRLFLLFLMNRATYYGGAIYVADETISGVCASDSYETYTSSTECFLQSLNLQGKMTDSQTNMDIKFTKNIAYTSGNALYGGLLDRCTLSPFNQIYSLPRENLTVHSGLKYFELYSNIKQISISSGPVRVCFCRGSYPDCNYELPAVIVSKGEQFYVKLTAVDQLGFSKSKVSILSSLLSGLGRLGENQSNQTTVEGCTDLKFEIFSPNPSEVLKMYAVGPCKDEKLSQKLLSVRFSPCLCPIGFKKKVTEKTNCMCECDSLLERYTTKCDSKSKTILRKGNPWISYFRSTDNFTSGYLVYLHCPFGYCFPSGSNIHINLSKDDGSDVQCLSNRSGLLCGSCKQGFSLSLGTTRCIVCQSYWPALFVLQLAAAFIAGIALVVLLLCLNITVAVGTLNGIIFYANILYTFKSTFVQDSSPTFASVFISWLNLEIGFDSCFFDGMDTYSKTWIQLFFPSYVLFLVVTVIVLSARSKRLSNLLAKKNPVATLATLILLSYTKFLNIIITSFSFGIITYPGLNGPIHRIVWLPDASILYLSFKHVILFITAFLIFLGCMIYSGLLFFWQWLTCFGHVNNRLIKLIRSQKMSHFIETYHAPYTKKNRYWTGLLLTVRMFLYIASASNVSGNPNVNLLVIGLVTLAVLFIKEIVGINHRIYKKWPIDILEISIYINIIVLCISTIFTNIVNDEKSKAGINNTSVAIIFLMFVGIISYHVFFEVSIIKTNIWKRLTERHSPSQNELDLSVKLISTTPTATSSVVERPKRLASKLLRANPLISGNSYELREILLENS